MPTLPLFPDSDPAPLVGIARLDPSADPMREGDNLECFPLLAVFGWGLLPGLT